MDLLLPGLAGARRILLPSTSSRIAVDGTPMQSSSYHLFVQVTDPTDIARVWSQLLPGRSPCLSRRRLGRPRCCSASCGRSIRAAIPIPCAHSPWSIFDPTTGSPERLVFDGAPVVGRRGAEGAAATSRGLRRRAPRLAAFPRPRPARHSSRLNSARVPRPPRSAAVRASAPASPESRSPRRRSQWSARSRPSAAGPPSASCTARCRAYTAASAVPRELDLERLLQHLIDGQPFVFDNGGASNTCCRTSATEIRCYGGSLPQMSPTPSAPWR